MKLNGIERDTNNLLRATKRFITKHGIHYLVNPSTIDRNLQDLEGLKKNIFLITRRLKAGDSLVEFRTDTIHAEVYKNAEEKFMLDEKLYKDHLYNEGDYIAEIID